MGDTAISWTHRPGTRGRTWNPTKGCSRVSAGCQRCYAEVQAARIVRMGKGKPTVYDDLVRVTSGGEPRWTGKVILDAETLAAPLRWRQPSTVFVNSMSDLFHESLTNEQIAAVFGVMAACPQHVFMVLTKRADRMRAWFGWVDDDVARSDWMRDPRRPNAAPAVHKVMEWLARTMPPGFLFQENVSNEWPLPNVWLGVSVEDQDAADERIPQLLKTRAAVRFLSCEPLLSDLDLRAYLLRGNFLTCTRCRFASNAPTAVCPNDGTRMVRDFGIDWVITGCESGPNARPCATSWLRSLRDQCAEAGVPYFLKQGRDVGDEHFGVDHRGMAQGITCGTGSRRKPGGVIELPYLDGVQHINWPGAAP